MPALGHKAGVVGREATSAFDAVDGAHSAASKCHRVVALKQTALMLHRTRQLLVRQRTMLSNALRGHLAELGIVSAKGRNGTADLLKIIADGADNRVSSTVRGILEVLARQYGVIGTEIASIDK